MPTNARATFALTVSLIMMGLGVFVAVRPIWRPGGPLTSSWWLDGAFAVFFVLRGMYGVRMARRASAAPPAA